MKKNITINLFGSLYAIDEDAYELLKKYEDNLRSYFNKQEGGDEIADDIEHRIAELFEELKQQGIEAISIENIEEIIRRIGKPEEMDTDEENKEDTEAEPHKAPEPEAPAHKKFFRDPKDCMLGGVLSGLSHYFGGDVLIWRLLTIALCIFTSFTFLLVYIVIWILTPEAHSAEDFLRMYGKDVTPDNIGQTVVNGQRAADAKSNGQPARTGFDSFLAFCAIVLKIGLYAIAFIIFGIFGISLFIALVATIGGMITGDSPIAMWVASGTPQPHLSSLSIAFTWVLLVAGLTAFVLPVYFLVHHLLRRRRNSPPMGTTQRVALLAVEFVSILLIALSLFIIVKDLQRSMNRSEYAITDKDFHNDWDNFSNEIANETDSIVNEGTPQNIQTEKEDTINNLTPGVYALSVKALADSHGCFAYVVLPNGNILKKEIAVGNPMKSHKSYNLSITANGCDVSKNKSETNYKEADRDYPEVTIDSIRILRPCTLRYGVTHAKGLTGTDWHGRHFVYNRPFLQKIGELK